ncbi:hypothetical protein M0812_17167 [Anaeramoeba flamelloides]|uniref:Uncharacterized protein n=1 Tax=Anaeramoeba flamelloides TaxID=1746091 RepID=A0AAV7ZA80_9EUKA|nr:hypothetical protein M0812_17167 [Anaeramoeba flamelloides]
MSNQKFQTLNKNSFSSRTNTSSPVPFFIQNSRNSPVLHPIKGAQLYPIWYASSNSQALLELKRTRSNLNKTSQRMKSKTQVEKVAIQALCLLGTTIFFDDQIETLFEVHNQKKKTHKQNKIKKKKKKVKRKRSVQKKHFHTIGTKISVKLSSPIGKGGSLKIKCKEGAPKFATPSTYPRHTGLRIKKN